MVERGVGKEKMLPSTAVAGGSVTPVSVRSGAETAVLFTEGLQLLLSLASGTTRVSSAQASKKYVPAAIPAGTVTLTVPLEIARGPSEATARLPLSKRAPLLDVVVEK